MPIPKHWQVIKLNNLVIAQKGRKPLKLSKKQFTDSISYLDIEAITTGVITQFADIYSTIKASPNDIFIVADGSRSGLVAKGMTGAVGSTILCLTPLVIDKLYLFYFLKSKYNLFNSNTTGVSIPHLNKDLLLNLEVIVPPPDEQQVIVETLEVNLKIFDSEFKNIENELVNIDHYRRSLINQAILGNLTKDKVLNDSKTESYNVTNMLSSKLPVDWRLLKSNMIFEFVTSGSRSWAKYYSNTDGALFIRIGNLNRNSLRINLSKEKTNLVKLPSDIEGTRTKLENGDILISITGDKIGLIGFIENRIGEAYINQHIALARSRKEHNSKYLAYCLLSDFAQDQLRSKTTGVTRAGLGLDDINNIYLLIPPLKDQDNITSFLDEQYDILESKEFEFNNTLIQRNKLQISILEHAFDGHDYDSIDIEWFPEFLKKIEVDRHNILESIKNAKNKAVSNYRNLRINMENYKSILEILQDAQNNTLAVNEVWRNSTYYEKSNVEGFYEELEELLKNKNSVGRVYSEFKDDQKMHSMLKLIRNAD